MLCFPFFYYILFHGSDRIHFYIFRFYFHSLTHFIVPMAVTVRMKSTRFSLRALHMAMKTTIFSNVSLFFLFITTEKKGSFTSKIHFIPFHTLNRCLFVGTSSLKQLMVAASLSSSSSLLLSSKQLVCHFHYVYE